MKFPSIFLLTFSLGLNVTFPSPTFAQLVLNSLPIQNPLLQAQTPDIGTLLQQAFQYTQQGKPQQAIEAFEQILRLTQQQGDKANEGIAHLGLGLNYDRTGQPQPALENYRQALSIFREVGDRSGEATTLNNLGLVYRDNNQPDQAIKIWEESLIITLEVRKGLNRSNRLAFIEQERGTAVALVDLLIKLNFFQENQL